MIDHDVSDQLHSLAATIDEPFDIPALRRRISVLNRRRSAVRVGVAGVGAAAVVGGLIMVRDRPAPAASEAAAAAPVHTAAVAAAPDCAVVIAELDAAKSAPAPDVRKQDPANVGAFPELPEAAGFKGIVTIQTVDGPRITFSSVEPKIAPPTDGVATLDASTEWVDGETALDAPPVLQVGEEVGLATTPVPDDVDRVIFVDISAIASPEDKVVAADDKPGAAADETVALPSGVAPEGPTDKSPGTIAAVGATSIDVTLETGATAVIDVTGTTFYAGDTPCAPGVLTVGTSVGVAYHLADDGSIAADAVLLIPST